MTDLPRIDVIIPCYHCHKTLARALASVLAQSEIEDIDITLVNDGDTKDYSEFVNTFKKFMSIREIKLKKNSGPSDARQYGIDNTKNPLIIFLDADDEFSGEFAIRTLRQQILAEPVNVVCYSNFLEEQPQGYVQHPQNSTWVFGACYKRSFLDKYEIRFMPHSHGNEDTGMNFQCKLCANQYEQIKYINDITYYWNWTPKSIVRQSNAVYSWSTSYRGYCNNMIYAIKHAEKKCPFNGQILMQKVMVMCNLFEYLLEVKERDSRFYEQNWQCCRKYYAEIYREVKDKISDEIFAEVYAGVMKNAYMGDKMFKIIPEMGIRQFLQKLEDNYNPDEKEFPMTGDDEPYDEYKVET